MLEAQNRQLNSKISCIVVAAMDDHLMAECYVFCGVKNVISALLSANLSLRKKCIKLRKRASIHRLLKIAIDATSFAAASFLLILGISLSKEILFALFATLCIDGMLYCLYGIFRFNAVKAEFMEDITELDDFMDFIDALNKFLCAEITKKEFQNILEEFEQSEAAMNNLKDKYGAIPPDCASRNIYLPSREESSRVGVKLAQLHIAITNLLCHSSEISYVINDTKISNDVLEQLGIFAETIKYIIIAAP